MKHLNNDDATNIDFSIIHCRKKETYIIDSIPNKVNNFGRLIDRSDKLEVEKGKSEAREREREKKKRTIKFDINRKRYHGYPVAHISCTAR